VFVFHIVILRRLEQCKNPHGTLLNVSWKSPGNLLGWICRHPVHVASFKLLTDWFIDWLAHSKNGTKIASSRRQMAGSPPNMHTMDSTSACIQGVLKIKVKGHMIRALLCWHENGFFSQATGLIASKLAHDGHQVSLHPGCSQGQGQRSRDTHTFLDSWNELLHHWRSGWLIACKNCSLCGHDVCSDAHYTASDSVSYLWGGSPDSVEVSEPHDVSSRGSRHAVLLSALSLSVIRLQRRHRALQKGCLSFISFMSHQSSLTITKTLLSFTCFISSVPVPYLYSTVNQDVGLLHSPLQKICLSFISFMS